MKTEKWNNDKWLNSLIFSFLRESVIYNDIRAVWTYFHSIFGIKGEIFISRVVCVWGKFEFIYKRVCQNNDQMIKFTLSH